jgi:hypothetical protein
MERPATTYPTGWRATRRTDERRAQAGAVASIAGPTMSAAAAALLRAVGETRGDGTRVPSSTGRPFGRSSPIQAIPEQAPDTPQTAKSSTDPALRAIARPGLEPGTPRFSAACPADRLWRRLRRNPVRFVSAAGSASRRPHRRDSESEMRDSGGRLPGRRAVARSARPVPASCIGTAWARRPQPRRIPTQASAFAFACQHKPAPCRGASRLREQQILGRPRAAPAAECLTPFSSF